MDPPPASEWTWNADANVFYGYNYQQRKFADFWAWESQNWFMLDGTRAVGNGRLTLDGMLSLEPFTIQALGSPQIYQTGESYQRVPLVNYQHPHDLIMGPRRHVPDRHGAGDVRVRRRSRRLPCPTHTSTR
ncbi:MAG: hypothetical protein HY047_06220 [Acidobacteria bacterium]|nr:hypothetical protein [Acidobacteriota bacterium]